VFLAGHWKNFDELESSLSINELNALVKALRDKEYREMKFHAAMNGVDLDEGDKDSGDINELKNSRIAKDEGFGVGEGLGFMEL
jgi:hypothetical protein